MTVNREFTVGDTVSHPSYGVGTVLSIIKEGSMITIYGDTFPNPSTLLGIEFVKGDRRSPDWKEGIRMAMSPKRVTRPALSTSL